MGLLRLALVLCFYLSLTRLANGDEIPEPELCYMLTPGETQSRSLETNGSSICFRLSVGDPTNPPWLYATASTDPSVSEYLLVYASRNSMPQPWAYDYFTDFLQGFQIFVSPCNGIANSSWFFVLYASELPENLIIQFNFTVYVRTVSDWGLGSTISQTVASSAASTYSRYQYAAIWAPPAGVGAIISGSLQVDSANWTGSLTIYAKYGYTGECFEITDFKFSASVILSITYANWQQYGSGSLTNWFTLPCLTISDFNATTWFFLIENTIVPLPDTVQGSSTYTLQAFASAPQPLQEGKVVEGASNALLYGVYSLDLHTNNRLVFANAQSGGQLEIFASALACPNPFRDTPVVDFFYGPDSFEIAAEVGRVYIAVAGASPATLTNYSFTPKIYSLNKKPTHCASDNDSLSHSESVARALIGVFCWLGGMFVGALVGIGGYIYCIKRRGRLQYETIHDAQSMQL